MPVKLNNYSLFNNITTNQRHIYFPIGSEREKIEKKYKDIMIEELSLGSFVSYVPNKHFPILRLYRFKEAFGFNLVQEFLKRFNANIHDCIFDPFCGLGTTLFISFLNKIHSIGVDKLPIAHFISNTIPIFPFLEEGKLIKFWTRLENNIYKYTPAPIALDVPIIQYAFDKDILLTLRKIKSAISELPPPYNDVLLLLLLSILEECSYTSKDGQYLRLIPDKKVSDPIFAMYKKILLAEHDIKIIKTLFPQITLYNDFLPIVYYGDTRDLSNIQFYKTPTILITSPPYVNRYDYSRTYSLELCFHFVRCFEELKQIRFDILRSHIESKIANNEEPNHPVIDEVIRELSYKSLNNPRIPIMLITYFIDMEKAISQWHKILSKKSKLAIVVDNVRFEGEVIPVDLILCDFAEKLGFKVNQIIIARYKGNSSQQMRKYGKCPVRESIIIWEK